MTIGERLTLRTTNIRGQVIARAIRVCVAALALLVAGMVIAQGQQVRQADRVYRIGIVSPNSQIRQIDEAFQQALRELGYVEGRNVVFEVRYAEGKPERLPELVAELVRLKVDVIVAGATTAVIAAKKATTTIPIVFASVFDPVGSGIVTTLARPGGNATGVAIGVSGEGFGGKWTQLLKDTAPNVARVAVLWNSANLSSTTYVREVQAAAGVLNMKVDLLDAGNATNLRKAFLSIGANDVQGLIVTPDPFFHAERTELVRLVANRRLPAIYFSKLFVDAGGLMSYGASFEDSWRKASVYVDKILKGARPADLPIEQPTKFELIVNLKAARALGIAIPSRVVLQADQVIE